MKDVIKEIERCKREILSSYKRESFISEFVSVRQFSEETDARLNFISIGLHHVVPMKWFTDESYYPGFYCNQLGRGIGIGEKKYLLEKIEEYSKEIEPQETEFRVKKLISITKNFIDEGFSPTIFIPLKYFVEINTVAATNYAARRPIMDFSGRIHKLIVGGTKVPIMWSNKFMDFKKVILFDKHIGIWIFKCGNTGQRLTINFEEERNHDEIKVLVKTEVFYKGENRNAMKIVNFTERKEKEIQHITK